MSNRELIQFGAFNPRQNLPACSARKRAESNFLTAFERDFIAGRAGQGIGGRHFSLFGYGIADFVWMDFGQREKSNSAPEPLIIAFEMKIKNWKKAISQAHRYRYFSDRSIVVLPEDTADKAERHLPIFEHLGVGLWSYSPNTVGIQMRFTPVNTKAKSPEAREKAIAHISRKLELRKARK
ncbi:hypothetical protein IMZ48_22975 [Candidatus Bathyarchaeota archaeon]|nr:hypothetical protein [Candidatus Bathyarchaeota archaeon]